MLFVLGTFCNCCPYDGRLANCICCTDLVINRDGIDIIELLNNNCRCERMKYPVPHVLTLRKTCQWDCVDGVCGRLMFNKYSNIILYFLIRKNYSDVDIFI